jgi:hypothetical protein
MTPHFEKVPIKLTSCGWRDIRLRYDKFGVGAHSSTREPTETELPTGSSLPVPFAQ